MTRGVRFRNGEPEMRCERCRARSMACYWPITAEFWDQSRGLAMCRACHHERRRLEERERYRRDPERRRRELRHYREENARILAMKARERWSAMDDAARERANETSRRWREANPERQRLIKQRWRDKQKAVVDARSAA